MAGVKRPLYSNPARTRRSSVGRSKCWSMAPEMSTPCQAPSVNARSPANEPNSSQNRPTASAQFASLPLAEQYRAGLEPLRIAHAVFISEAFKTEATAAAPGLFDGRSTVVYDAVSPPVDWSPAERAARRNQMGLPTDTPLIALTGQISEVKGIWDFVAAADRLRQTNAVFVVLGDDLKGQGTLRRQMEAEVARLGLRERFRFLGFRSDAPEIVQLFDIVAVPSHVEPFGLASLEAMAAGRPVVATRVGGIPEVVVDGVTGILVPQRDPAAFAGALAELLAAPAQRDEMGRRGRQRSHDLFSQAAHARGLTAVYGRLQP